MRQITKKAINAFKAQKNFSLDNTRVEGWEITKMFLYWNLIAQITKNNLAIYSAWWETHTTKERLNWILESLNLWKIKQIKGQWYLVNNGIKEVFNWQKNFII